MKICEIYVHKIFINIEERFLLQKWSFRKLLEKCNFIAFLILLTLTFVAFEVFLMFVTSEVCRFHDVCCSNDCQSNVCCFDVCRFDIWRSDVWRSDVWRSDVFRFNICRFNVCFSNVCRLNVCRFDVCQCIHYKPFIVLNIWYNFECCIALNKNVRNNIISSFCVRYRFDFFLS